MMPPDREMTPEEKEEEAKLEEQQKLNRMLEVKGAEAVIQYLRDRVKERDIEIKRLRAFGDQSKKVEASLPEATDSMPSKPEQPGTPKITQLAETGPNSK